MSRVMLIAQHQFKKEVTKRSFLLVLFSLPLFLAFSIGFGYLMSLIEDDTIWLGYVDEAGFLTEPTTGYVQEDINIVPFVSVEEASAALEANQISAYYVIPPNYAETKNAKLVYHEPLPYRARRTFETIVRLNLLAGQSPNIVERTLDGAHLTVVATENNREYAGGDPSFGYFLPLLTAAIFSFLALTTAGYMADVVTEEKENRTMEIIVTSVSPGRMIMGKIFGAVGIAIVQLTVWLVFFMLAYWVGKTVLDVDWLQNIEVYWQDIAGILVVAIPCYLFIAALMTTIGASMSESHEAQQVGPLFFLFIFIPIYFIVPIASNPNGVLALILSFFPLTAVPTIALRSLFIQVPFWQITVATVIATISAIITIWFAGKVFRAGMLRYGKRISWRELFRPQKSVRPSNPEVQTVA